MAGFAPGGGLVQNTGGSGPSQPIDVTGTGLVQTSPTIVNLPVPTMGVEVSIVMPAVVSFLVRSRKAAMMTLSYISGQSTSNYLTIPPRTFYSEGDLAPASRTLYITTSTDADTIELVYWT